MRSVNIAALKDGLSRYLNEVRQGEELLIRDRKIPVAKIIPLSRVGEPGAEELLLVAEGKLRLPEAPLSPAFWRMPAPRLTLKRLAAALEAERDDG
ncbi:MAG TPA: type II toxin-antitoxin system Phd/YefM family antitoxin [Terriglobia bacterium]|nr:type II toxin-antitoxin system Phd/YefM family antitoxin [Terriglobia bacterium]